MIVIKLGFLEIIRKCPHTIDMYVYKSYIYLRISIASVTRNLWGRNLQLWELQLLESIQWQKREQNLQHKWCIIKCIYIYIMYYAYAYNILSVHICPIPQIGMRSEQKRQQRPWLHDQNNDEGISGKIQGLSQKLTSTKIPKLCPNSSFKKDQVLRKLLGWNATLIVWSIRVLSESFPSTNLCSSKKNNGNPWKIDGKWKQPMEIHPLDPRGKRLSIQTHWKKCGKMMQRIGKIGKQIGASLPRNRGVAPQVLTHRIQVANEGFIFWIPY